MFPVLRDVVGTASALFALFVFAPVPGVSAQSTSRKSTAWCSASRRTIWIDGDLYNGRIVRIANSFVFKEPVFNYSGDFPFLWDEIKVPIRYGGDRVRARRLLEGVVEEVTGTYSRTARESWIEMVRQYRVEDAQVEPMVSLIATDNWLEFTVRYAVDYRRRRATKNTLFTRILEEIDAAGGQVTLVSATFELVAVPPIVVKAPHS